jgi:hypothetical protein
MDLSLNHQILMDLSLNHQNLTLGVGQSCLPLALNTHLLPSVLIPNAKEATTP